MQQFVVPQFIDIEDKIIGPITTRQFIILLADAFLVFLSYRFSDFSLFVLLLIVELIVGLMLAFVRVNGRPFHFFLLNLIQTASATPAPAVVRHAPPATSRLSELALIVDTGGVYHEEIQNS